MKNQKTKQSQRHIRKQRIRAVVMGSALRPRLAFFRSNMALSAQIIDDTKGVTLVSARSSKKNREAAKALGVELIEKAKAKKITSVVFDRGGFRYHGVVQVFADVVREGGIKF